MEQEKNFLDSLNDWGAILTDTYERGSYENLLEFPLLKKSSIYFDVFLNKQLDEKNAGKRILDIIIPDIETIRLEVKKHDINYTVLYYVNFHFVPLKDVIFKLEDGTEVKPSTLEALKKVVSFGLIISQKSTGGEIEYKISMSEHNVFSIFDVENATKHEFVPINLIDLPSGEDPVKFKTTLKNRLIEEGLKL